MADTRTPLLGMALLFVALFASLGARADCECIWGGPFTRVQADTDLVVSATVTTMRGNSIDLEVQQVLRGEIYTEQVRVWLGQDSDELCRADLGTFPLNSSWIMALDRIDEMAPGGFNPNTPNFSFGRVGDYSISRCGGYWLQRTENLVSGNLTGGARWDMNPKMSPVLLDLVAGFVAGDIDEDTLKEAGKVDPELQQLILETRLFLRRQR